MSRGGRTRRGPARQTTELTTLDQHRQWSKRRRCVCGKVSSDSREEVRQAATAAAALHGQANPVRYYQCYAGLWHWTSQVDELRYEAVGAELTDQQVAWLEDLARQGETVEPHPSQGACP